METNVQAGAPETPEQFIERRDKAIATWLDRKGALDSIKPQELEARNEVSTILFPTPKKGTNRYHLNGGYSVKLVHGTNYTLGDKDKVIGEGEEAVKVTIASQVMAMLDKLCQHYIDAGKTNEEAQELCRAIVKWKPELDEKTYLAFNTENNVEAVAKGIIDEILTTKPATPQLEFETPKKK